MTLGIQTCWATLRGGDVRWDVRAAGPAACVQQERPWATRPAEAEHLDLLCMPAEATALHAGDGQRDCLDCVPCLVVCLVHGRACIE